MSHHHLPLHVPRSKLWSSSYSSLHIVLLVCCLELVQVFSEHRQASAQPREFCSVKRYLSYSLYCFYKSSNLILSVEWSFFWQLGTKMDKIFCQIICLQCFEGRSFTKTCETWDWIIVHLFIYNIEKWWNIL